MIKKYKIKVIIILSLVLIVGYLYYKYQDYPCHGCMTIPSLSDARQRKVLIAVYTTNNPLYMDTLFLTKGYLHGTLYGYDTENYFLCSTKKTDNSNFFIHRTPIQLGSTELSLIPQQIRRKDLHTSLSNNYSLLHKIDKNIESTTNTYFIDKWKKILLY